MKNYVTALFLWTFVAGPAAHAMLASRAAPQDTLPPQPLFSSNCTKCWEISKKLLMGVDSTDHKKALEHAPILWFADQEEYFPTIPFFSAFDQVNNNGINLQIDFDDPEEIAPSEKNDSAPQDQATALKLVSWETLDAWYNRLETKEDSIAYVKALTSERDTLRTAIQSLEKIEEHLMNVLYEMSPKKLADSLESAIIKKNEELRKRIIERFDYFRQGRRNLMRRLDSLDNKFRQFSEKPELFKTEVGNEVKKRQCFVFYNVTKNFQARALGKLLYSDEQFWHRLRERKPKKYLDYLEKPGSTCTVLEYYLYYVNDTGLQGHPEDIERVFLFVPDVDSISFRVVVAAGHSNLVPNNVLFYEKDEILSQFKQHLHILVELGGHSNAPDIKGNGFFEPGVDANWHFENIWGTRDIQAIAGSGALGRYSSWMTFPRGHQNPDNKVYPPDSTNLAIWNHNFCYKLIPIKNFKELYEEFERCAKLKEPDSIQVIDTIKKIDKLFKEAGLPVTRLSNLAFTNAARQEYRQILEQLSLWPNDIVVSAEEAFGYNTLRSWNIALWFDWKVKNWQFSYPQIRFAGLIKIPCPIPAAMEAHWSYDDPSLKPSSISRFFRAKGRTSLALFYDTYYTRWLSALSVYTGVLWRNNPDDWSVHFGVSAVPPFFFPPYNTFRHFRLRLGGVYSLDDKRFSPALQFGIHFWPIPSTDQRYAKLGGKKHKIWEHGDFGKPDRLFKKFLFRRQGFGLGVNSLGFWTNWMKRESPELKIAYILPPWNAIPVKTDGVVELQLGHPWPGRTAKNDDWRWTLSLYYERFYGRLLSWYLDIACRDVSHLTVNDFGGGFSIMYPAIAGKHFPWIHLRLGLRSSINRESLQFFPPRLEFQLGIH